MRALIISGVNFIILSGERLDDRACGDRRGGRLDHWACGDRRLDGRARGDGGCPLDGGVDGDRGLDDRASRSGWLDSHVGDRCIINVDGEMRLEGIGGSIMLSNQVEQFGIDEIAVREIELDLENM